MHVHLVKVVIGMVLFRIINLYRLVKTVMCAFQSLQADHRLGYYEPVC